VFFLTGSNRVGLFPIHGKLDDYLSSHQEEESHCIQIRGGNRGRKKKKNGSALSKTDNQGEDLKTTTQGRGEKKGSPGMVGGNSNTYKP